MPLYLGDTSAWNRSKQRPEIEGRWAVLIAEGGLAITPPVSLELLLSAQGPADFAQFQDELQALPLLPLDEPAVERATRVQELLVLRGQHGGPKPMDLLIAAVAELHDAVLIHYDRHFDAVRRATGQPMEWLARRGSLE